MDFEPCAVAEIGIEQEHWVEEFLPHPLVPHLAMFHAPIVQAQEGQRIFLADDVPIQAGGAGIDIFHGAVAS